MDTRDTILPTGRHEACNFGPSASQRDGSENYGRCEPWRALVRALRGGTPAAYQQAERIKATLLERAAKASAAAWRLEMAQRACRIADTDAELDARLSDLFALWRELAPMAASDTGDML